MIKTGKTRELKGLVNNRSYFSLLMMLVLTITALAFSNSLKNGFINWDDDKLILENPYINNISNISASDFFSLKILQEYDPLTVITHAITYKFWKFDAKYYHLFNLFFHLLNVALVFWLVYLLFDVKFIALLTACLFAIHPTRVESVAWAAERKDLLYCVFYFSALLLYIYYVLVVVFFFFINNFCFILETMIYIF